MSKTWIGVAYDAEVMRYVGEFKPLDLAMAWRSMATHLGHWHLRGYSMWAVEEKSTGQMIGRVGLWYPEGWPGLEVGWMIHRACWGRGYATEAGRALIEAAYRELGVDHVISVIHPENTASMRVAERVGETFEREWTLHGLALSIYSIHRGISSG